MHKVVEARFADPNRGAQIFEEVANPAKRYYSYDEWELPEEAHAKLIKDEATICLPRRCGSSNSPHLRSF